MTIPSSIATLLPVSKSYAVGAQSTLSRSQLVPHKDLVWYPTKNFEVGHERIWDTDCKIASLVSVQTSTGSARAFVMRGDGCCCLFCVEHLQVHPVAGWKRAFLGPATECFVSLIFIAVCKGLNAYVYRYLWIKSLEGCLTPNFTSEMCNFWFHFLSLAMYIS